MCRNVCVHVMCVRVRRIGSLLSSHDFQQLDGSGHQKPANWASFWGFLFESRSQVAQTDLEFLILLPPLPECAMSSLCSAGTSGLGMLSENILPAESPQHTVRTDKCPFNQPADGWASMKGSFTAPSGNGRGWVVQGQGQSSLLSPTHLSLPVMSSHSHPVAGWLFILKQDRSVADA